MLLQRKGGRGILTERIAAPVGVGAMNGARVLVVEDDELVRLGIRYALSKAGCRVFEARDVAEALSSWDREAGAIDLVVADLFLRAGPAVELAEALHARGMKLPFVYISAHPPSLARSRGWIGPDAAFLQKPFAFADLVAVVRRALAEENGERAERSE